MKEEIEKQPIHQLTTSINEPPTNSLSEQQIIARQASEIQQLKNDNKQMSEIFEVDRSDFRLILRQLQERNKQLKHEIDEYEILFKLQWKRTREADEFWQKEHNEPDVWPDLGEVINWLMKKAGLK